MTGKFSKILYPTDFSELSLHALPMVRTLADAFESEVLCLHVVDEGYQTWAPIGPESVPITVPIDELSKIATEQMTAFAREHLTGFKKQPETRVVVGRAFVEIIAIGRDWGADVIVMPTHGRGAIAHMLLGSTTEKVVRKSPCPVLTVRDPEREYVAP